MIPDSEGPIILHTDWSKLAVGGWIAQEINGNLCPIAFESRKLNKTERSYLAYDGELLAIKHCIENFLPYLKGRRIILKSDQKALKHLLEQRTISSRQAKVLQLMLEMDIALEWIPGKWNTIADILSRYLSNKNVETQTEVNNLAIDENWIKELQENLKQDEFTKNIMKAIKGQDLRFLSKKVKAQIHRFDIHDGIVFYENQRVYVPKEMRCKIIQDSHDTPYAAHPSAESTFHLIARSYYWPYMMTEIRNYVKTCDPCQRNKDHNHLPYGLLKPLPIPRDYWTSISMDFITNLPKSKGFDCIMVVVCRLSKMVHIIANKTTDTAKEISRLFIENVFKNHGIPEEIITDRDPKFTSEFWKEFTKQSGISHKMSTAFHPETDGQTERQNRTIGQILRIFANYQQDNWFELLPFVEFSINNNPSATTKHTPFFLNYGRNPQLPSSFVISQEPKSIQDKQDKQTWIKQLIREAQDRQARFANTKRSEKTFKVGDKVLLKTNHYKDEILKGMRSKKIVNRFLGPYEIREVINQNAYRIKLPPSLKIHDVVNISALEDYFDPKSSPIDHPTYERPPPIFEQDYEVEKILDFKIRHKRPRYLVKWKGYPENESTWEREENLIKAQDILEDFKEQIKYIKST